MAFIVKSILADKDGLLSIPHLPEARLIKSTTGDS